MPHSTEQQLETQLIHDSTEPSVNVHNDSGPPLDRFGLPFEIISHIFCLSISYAFSIRAFDKPFEMRKHTKAVTYLSHVSRAWRGVALGTPELWSTLWIFLAAFRDPQRSIDQVRCWLGRTGQLPISVGLIFNGWYEEVISAGRIMEVIVPGAWRWKVFAIHGPVHVLPWVSSRLNNVQMSYVEHLSLHAHNLGTEPVRIDCAPRFLTLSNLYCHQISIDWSNLTEFKVLQHSVSWTTQDVRHLFQISPCLSTLDIKAWVEADETGDVGTVVTAPALQTLTIKSPSSKFWTSFTFPALTTLDISPSSYQLSSFWHSLEGMIRRSECRIQDLRIHYAALESAITISTLIRHLVHISVQGGVSLKPIMDQLEETATSSPGCLDNLQSFDLDIFDLSTPGLHSLGTFVRFNHLKSLRCARVIFHHPMSIPQCLSILKESGLEQLLEAAENLNFVLARADGEDLYNQSTERTSM